MKSLDHFSLGLASKLLWQSVSSPNPRALIEQARDHLDNVLDRLDKPQANSGPEVFVEPEKSAWSAALSEFREKFPHALDDLDAALTRSRGGQ